MDPAAGPKKIGLIGLGLMGRPMGMNLIKAGYALTVWNRTASRADELVAAGARLAKSPQEVAAACDFLLTIVSDPPALEEVLWGPSGAAHGLKRGSTYMDSSTVSPALARKIAARGIMPAEQIKKFLDQSPLLFRYETGLLTNEQFYAEVCAATGFRGNLDEFMHAYLRYVTAKRNKTAKK